jgi:hypothetical protein
MAKYRVTWTEYDNKNGNTNTHTKDIRGVSDPVNAVWICANDHVEWPDSAKLVSVVEVVGEEQDVEYVVKVNVPNLPGAPEDVRQIIETALKDYVTHDVKVKTNNSGNAQA